MEKFALLNLLKAIDGLKNAQPQQNTATPPPPTRSTNSKISEQTEPPHHEMPNIMYETLMRHEQMSNRLRNKR